MKSELNITIVYTALSIIAYLLLIIGLVLSLVTVLKMGAVLISLLIVGSYLIGQRHPKFLQMLYIEAEKKYAKRYLLSDIDTGAILGRMNELMEQERLYSQEDISLKHLAEVLSITPHQLSQLLNELLNTNFNSYVNQYRINEAKHILINEPERSVLSIAYAVGFNSKSSFYEAFSRFTGKTPHTFRKELLM
jgi:AraC-like DNA-binding protein